MNELLFSKKAFKESFLPNGEATDAEAECARYEEILSEHPIDIQVLGMEQTAILVLTNQELLLIR